MRCRWASTPNGTAASNCNAAANGTTAAMTTRVTDTAPSTAPVANSIGRSGPALDYLHYLPQSPP